MMLSWPFIFSKFDNIDSHRFALVKTFFKLEVLNQEKILLYTVSVELFFFQILFAAHFIARFVPSGVFPR